MRSAVVSTRPTLLRAWLDLARAGNLPSVASNVLAALVLSAPAGAGTVWPGPGLLALAVLAGGLIYAGGATLNDVADAAFDRENRPERAIPGGLVTRATAAWWGGAQLAAGVALLVLAGSSWVFAIALVATILAYDWYHKQWSGSVLLMAGCRILLALTVATLPGQAAGAAFAWWAGALYVYIVGLSVLARWEYQPDSPAETVAFAVRGLLMLIPLVDAVALVWVGAWLPAVACAAAIPLGRCAQRLAAST